MKTIKVKINEDQIIRIINGEIVLKRDGYKVVGTYVDRIGKDGIIVVFAPLVNDEKPSFFDKIKSIFDSKNKEKEA